MLFVRSYTIREYVSVRHNIREIRLRNVLLFHVRIVRLSPFLEIIYDDTILFSYLVYEHPEIPTPCEPSPCGANAVCKERNGAGSCACLPEYYGDPYNYCKPECIVNTDCDRSKACFNQKCKDPCPGVCGNNAECHVVNHSPSCICYPGYTGNPLTGCHEPPKSIHFSLTHSSFMMI